MEGGRNTHSSAGGAVAQRWVIWQGNIYVLYRPLTEVGVEDELAMGVEVSSGGVE